MPTVTRTAASVTPGAGWTGATVSNLATDDGAYATYTIAAKNTSGNVATLATFGFDGVIPSGSTINQVELLVNWKVSTTGGIAILGVTYAISGTPAAYDENSAEPLADTTDTFDVTADKAWTRADLLDAVFTALIRARSGNNATSVIYSFDYVAVRVTYTEPVSSQVILIQDDF